MKTISEDRAAPLAWDQKLKRHPFVPSNSSAGLGWPGVRVEHYADHPDEGDVTMPPLEDTLLILTGRNTARGRFECDDRSFDGQPAEGSVTVAPAGAASRYRWRGEGEGEVTHFALPATTVIRVAAEVYDGNPDGVRLHPVVNGSVHPLVRTTLMALRDELLTGGPGGRVCAESLATVLAVHLIRHLANGPAVRGLTGVLARSAVKAVEEFVMDNLDASIGLADLAAVVHLSEYHFARLFKQTTGQTPHQFVITKRVEKAKELIRGRRLTLVEVAAAVGFSDQSHLNRHFKRLVGVTPKQFG